MRTISSRQYLWVYTTLLLSVAAVLAGLGCGGNADEATTATSSPAASPPVTAADQGAPKSATRAKAGTVAATAVPRKIIYNADIELVADNLSTAQQALMRIVTAHKGYVAESKIGGAAGSKRDGTWKIRVPVDEYSAALAEISKLGELQSIHSDSQDVSAEYFDLEAHISNKQVEEKRLLMHLQKSTARLQDILTVEREISRVRGEIEEMQGRLRVLANQTALSTITVSVSETREYTAPKPETFGQKITQTFVDSVHALRDLVEFIILVVVGFLPWLVTGALVLAIAWPFGRRALTRSAARRNADVGHYVQYPPPDPVPPRPPDDNPRPGV